jgi:hypothetical protein
MKKIVMGTSALLITFKCNLRCKICCTNTPHREISRQVDFSLEELKIAISKYYGVISYIRKFSLGGGEPTLHKDLPKLIEYIMNFKEQFEILEIITNGVAVPRENIIHILEKYKEKVFVLIDNYGENISRSVSTISNLLEKHSIKHQIRNYNAEDAHHGGWVDLGDFSHKNTAPTATTIYRSCITANKKKNNTITVGDIESENKDDVFFINYAANTLGKIHRCARAYSTLEAGVIKDIPQNFVNTLDENKSVQQIREEIIAMWSSDYYEPCEYCNGFDENSKRYIPAEQL